MFERVILNGIQNNALSIDKVVDEVNNHESKIECRFKSRWDKNI